MLVSDALSDLGPPLYRYFCGSFPALQAADLTQDCLLRLLEKCRQGKFDPSRGTLRMYAFGIAHFIRLEHRKEPAWEELVDNQGKDPDLVERLALRRAIARLPEAERAVVLLLVDKDLSLAEIGEILALPLNTVKSHVHRAKRNLREILRQEGCRHG